MSTGLALPVNVNSRWEMFVLRLTCLPASNFSICDTVRPLLPKSILPKKYELNIKYGISDPYTYGISYAILAPLTGILDENLKVDPTFGKNNFESELNASKRVPLYKIIEPALKLLLDKKFRSIVFNKNDLDDEDRSKDIGE